MNDLGWYTVVSVSIQHPSRRPSKNNIMATSVEDALAFERRYFGYPHFRIITAYPVGAGDFAKGKIKE